MKSDYFSSITNKVPNESRLGSYAINSRQRTSSTVNRQTFQNQGASIIKDFSKSKIEAPFKEEKSLKLPNDLMRESRNNETRSTKGIVGFQNLGNTCFMNSILQCLVRLPVFREVIQSINSSNISATSKLRGYLALAFKSFIQEIRTSNNFTVISPFEIKRQMGIFARQFSGYEQQDSAEFLRYLLDGLHFDLNRVSTKPRYQEMTGNTSEDIKIVADRWWHYSLSRDDSIITDIFQGQFSSVITCEKCGYGSISCDSFLSINLPSPESYIRSTTLDQCLVSYFKETNLPSSYKCEKCKAKNTCNQKITLNRFPKVLILQLKRFLVDGFRKERLNTEISYPEELNLKTFKSPKCDTFPKYILNGISHHIGSLTSGHYISECREDNRWYCFDDSRAYVIETPSRSSTAYLLFYIANP